MYNCFIVLFWFGAILKLIHVVMYRLPNTKNTYVYLFITWSMVVLIVLDMRVANVADKSFYKVNSFVVIVSVYTSVLFLVFLMLIMKSPRIIHF